MRQCTQQVASNSQDVTLGNDQRAGRGCADAQEIEGKFPWWLREKRRKAVCCCDPVTALTSHLGQISTSFQAKRSCNSFCKKPHHFVQRCTSASQAKLQGTLQWWSNLQTVLSWIAAFIAWAGQVPHVNRGQRTYYTQVSAFAWCCNQIEGGMYLHFHLDSFPSLCSYWSTWYFAKTPRIYNLEEMKRVGLYIFQSRSLSILYGEDEA